MEPLQRFPNCHPECLPSCFTQASASFHNGVRGRNSRVLHQIFFSLVNEAIEEIIPGRVFDPIAGFMADEAGGI